MNNVCLGIKLDSVNRNTCLTHTYELSAAFSHLGDLVSDSFLLYSNEFKAANDEKRRKYRHPAIKIHSVL